MDIAQALILGVVQGLTEFFPISSSGHLIVLPEILNWDGIVNSLSFSIALHFGTFFAIIFFFWKDFVKILKNLISAAKEGKNLTKQYDSRLLLLLITGSVPAAISGFLLKNFIESNTRSIFLVGFMLIIFGILLWYIDRISEKRKDITQVDFRDAILIGIAQAVSLIPGVSRSGATITMARFLGIDRESSVRFSFLLAAPVVLGASLYSSTDIFKNGIDNMAVFIFGFLAAVISGFFAIKFLIYLSKRNNFNLFVVYRIILGVLLIIYSLFLS